MSVQGPASDRAEEGKVRVVELDITAVLAVSLIATAPLTVFSAIVLPAILGWSAIPLTILSPALLVVQHRRAKAKAPRKWSLVDRFAISVLGEKILRSADPEDSRPIVDHPQSAGGEVTAKVPEREYTVSSVQIDYDAEVMDELAERLTIDLTLHVSARVERPFHQEDAVQYLRTTLDARQLPLRTVKEITELVVAKMHAGTGLLVVEHGQVVYHGRSKIVRSRPDETLEPQGVSV